MKTLVLGSNGFLGKEICKLISAPNLVRHQRRNKDSEEKIYRDNIIYFDIEKETFERCTSNLKFHDIETIYNCIALTSIEESQMEPEKAKLLNEIFPKDLANFCFKNNIKLIHYSTDAVFSGKIQMPKESDLPDPISIYGKTKLDGENAILSNNKKASILRVNFYGNEPARKSIFNYFLEAQEYTKIVDGFEDVFFNPIWVRNLAKISILVPKSNLCGVLHVSGDTVLSKYEFGNLVSRLTKQVPVNRISIEKTNFKIARSRNLTLDNSLMKIKGFSVPGIEMELIELVKELNTSND